MVLSARVKKVNSYSDFKYVTSIKFLLKSISAYIFLFTNHLSTQNFNFRFELQVAMGLPLPNWCSEEDYEKLTDNADIFYDAMSHTDLARRVLVGPVAEAFVKHINDSETSENKKKIYLYAGHDANLAAFARAFNFTNIPDIPEYGSAIIVEKWKGPTNDANIRVFIFLNNT